MEIDNYNFHLYRFKVDDPTAEQYKQYEQFIQNVSFAKRICTNSRSGLLNEIISMLFMNINVK